MMKALGTTLTWAIVVGALGAAIWWMLSKDMTAGRWLLAAFLFGHGAVHLLYGAPADAADTGGTAWPFDMSRSWLVPTLGVEVSVLRIAGWGLIAVATAGFVLAALSSLAIGSLTGWWPATVVVPSIASAVLLLVFFSPQLLVGLTIDAALIWLSVSAAWTL